MKNLWSEGGAAVTPNVMISSFSFFPAQSEALSQHLLEYGSGLAFTAPCASVSDPHMQAQG